MTQTTNPTPYHHAPLGGPVPYSPRPTFGDPSAPTTFMAPPAPQPERTNPMAVLALVLAFVASPLGIVCGVIARRQISRSGEGGRGLATTGLVLGIVFTVLGVLTATAVLLFALVIPPTLDLTPVKDQIVRTTTSVTGVAPTGLVCPADVHPATGGVFTCTGTLDGQLTRYTVTQTDMNGHVTFTSDTFVVVATVAKKLSEEMAAKAGVDVGASCDAGGRTVIVGGRGTSFPCTVTNAQDPTDHVEITATITDDAGNVSFAVND